MPAIDKRLFQVFVQETASGQILAVFPRCPKDMAQDFCEKINRGIALGKERDWTNPHVVECSDLRDAE